MDETDIQQIVEQRKESYDMKQIEKELKQLRDKFSNV
jgi:hypothetical protein